MINHSQLSFPIGSHSIEALEFGFVDYTPWLNSFYASMACDNIISLTKDGRNAHSGAPLSPFYPGIWDDILAARARYEAMVAAF